MGSPFPCLLILLIALIAVALALFIGISFVLGGAIAIQRAARVDSMSNPAEEARRQPRKRWVAVGIAALIVGVLILCPVMILIVAAISTILKNMR